MIVALKRRAAFSAAHSYSMTSLSPEENNRLFGSFAGDSEGHGHNYLVEVTVSGPVDDRTGMVVNIVEIDRILKAEVVGVLDGKFLNREVAYFLDHAPTTENLTTFVRQAISQSIPEPARLTGVVVWEMNTLRAEWNERDDAEPDSGGQRMGMTSLTRSYDFSAAHRLHSSTLSDDENLALFGKCNNPNGHGHNYDIEVTITGTPDGRSGMIFPLEALDRAVEEEVLGPMDHKHLNLDVPEFAADGGVNPTSEMLAVVIWRRLAKRLPTEGDPRLSKVLVRETARNSFEYAGQ